MELEIEFSRHIDVRVARLETEMPHLATKADIARMETRMTKWVVGAAFGGMAVAVAIATLVMRVLA